MSWRGDRWGCKNCSKTYDKWGMIDHLCNKNGRNFTEPPRGATGHSTTATAFTVVDDNKFCISRKRSEYKRYDPNNRIKCRSKSKSFREI